MKTTEGKISPYFKYPAQAFEYVKKYYNNSQYVHIHEVRKKGRDNNADTRHKAT